MQLISQRLRRRTATAGADPLVTYYDLGTGERTELSAVTVTNWVNKTCHLLVDEYGLDLGDLVQLDVARTHPGHWVTVCLELACWSLGVTVAVDGGADADARCGWSSPVRCTRPPPSARPSSVPTCWPAACTRWGCRSPSGCPTVWPTSRWRSAASRTSTRPSPSPEDELAWRSAEATLTQAELAAARESTQRRLLRPSTPWADRTRRHRGGPDRRRIGGGGRG